MIQIKLDAMTLSEPKVCDALSLLIKALSDYGVTLNTSKRSHQLIFTNEQGSKVYLKGDTLHMLVEGTTSHPSALPSALLSALSRDITTDLSPDVKSDSSEAQEGSQREGKTARVKKARVKTGKGEQIPPLKKPQKSTQENNSQRVLSKKTPIKKGKSAYTKKRPKRHLKKEEFSSWLESLSIEQKRFVSALSTKGSLSVNESYQLLNVPKELQSLKRLNGLLGSIARWSCPEKDASLVVPWEAEGGAYVWRPDLIKS